MNAHRACCLTVSYIPVPDCIDNVAERLRPISAEVPHKGQIGIWQGWKGEHEQLVSFGETPSQAASGLTGIQRNTEEDGGTKNIFFCYPESRRGTQALAALNIACSSLISKGNHSAIGVTAA